MKLYLIANIVNSPGNLLFSQFGCSRNSFNIKPAFITALIISLNV
jgi:hypothetical protein